MGALKLCLKDDVVQLKEAFQWPETEGSTGRKKRERCPSPINDSEIICRSIFLQKCKQNKIALVVGPAQYYDEAER